VGWVQDECKGGVFLFHLVTEFLSEISEVHEFILVVGRGEEVGDFFFQSFTRRNGGKGRSGRGILWHPRVFVERVDLGRGNGFKARGKQSSLYSSQGFVSECTTAAEMGDWDFVRGKNDFMRM